MDYFLKASAVIALFYLCFYFFLKKETFFQHNRWFLLVGLVIALTFPLIVIPIYTPIDLTTASGNIYTTNETTIETITTIQPKSVFEWKNLIPILYSIGLCALFIQFLLQFGSLILLLIKNPKNKEGFYTYVIVKNKISPFSFFRWIVYNPENYNTDELQLILIHEKVHASQMHSIDILCTQIACVIFWFNPLIWLYRREIRQNLEYIADFRTQSISKTEKEYQHLLLKTSVTNHNVSLSNNFYNSLIKERIVMLKKSRSNRKNQWKYLLILPLLGGLLMSMNTEKIYIKSNKETSPIKEKVVSKTTKDTKNKTYKTITKPGIKTENSIKKASLSTSTKTKENIAMAIVKKANKQPQLNDDILITMITKNTTNSELNKIKDQLKKEGLKVKFKAIKRNKNGEITAIKIDIKSKTSNASYNTNSDQAINPIKIVYNEYKNSILIGNDNTGHREDTFVYESENNNHKIHKSKNGDYVFVTSEEEHENEHEHEHEHGEKHEHDSKIIIEHIDKKGKQLKQTKNIEVIHEDRDEDEVIEIIVNKDNKENLIILQNSHNNSNVYFSSDRNKEPLYIVDGKEVSRDHFTDLNPKLIESITILKDKNATEKYGNKGKDGVIIVTTKKKN